MSAHRKTRIGVVGVVALAAMGAAIPACFFDWGYDDAAERLRDDGGPDAVAIDTGVDVVPRDANGGDVVTVDGSPDDGRCSPSRSCPSGSYCAFADGICGAKNMTGTCVPASTACDFSSSPLGCACTPGAGLDVACVAQAKGNDVGSDIARCIKDNTFLCRDKVCVASDQYCRLTTTDARCEKVTCTNACRCEDLGASADAKCTCTELVKGSGMLVVRCP